MMINTGIKAGLSFDGWSQLAGAKVTFSVGCGESLTVEVPANPGPGG